MTQPSGIRMSTRLLDEMRDLMRRRHYSIHTERAYRDWVKRYVRFHDMQSRDDLRSGEEKMKALTVCSGKGDKNRITTLPEVLVQPRKEHLVRVNSIIFSRLAPGQPWRIGPWPAEQRETWGMSRIGTLHRWHASLVRPADSGRREVTDRSDVNENPGCRRSAAAPGSPASTALRRRCGPRPTRTGAFRSRRGTTPSAPAPRARRTPASRPPR